ncbi:MAG: gliding motility-associated C-terminal domain-containing protein [Bacteroidota bacterium]
MNIKGFFVRLLFVHLLFQVSISLQAQGVYIEEDFDNWIGSCASTWDCSSSTGCVAPKCNWNRQDAFSQQGIPAVNDCDGNGLYARCHTIDLLPGETPLLESPIVDLSAYNDTNPLKVFFCMINTSIGPVDNDTLWLESSNDGGLNWTTVWMSDTVEAIWTNKSISIPPSSYSSTFQLRFKGSGNKSLGDIGVDNIEFRSEDVCAPVSPTLSIVGNNRICSGEKVKNPSFTSDFSGSQSYQFYLTDTLNRVLRPLPGDSLDYTLLPIGHYRVYALFYASPPSFFPLTDINSLTSQSCVQLSSNYLEIERFEIEAIAEASTNYNGFDVSQFGASDGAANIMVNGGTAPYEIDWAGFQSNSLSRTGLEAGEYHISVVDQQGCEGETSLTLTQPQALTVEIQVLQSSQCAGDSLGRLVASISGGVRPYSYSWSTGQPSNSINKLPAGEYAVLVSDANGASSSDSYRLSSPPPLSIRLNDYDEICSFDEGPTVEVMVSGGTSPYAIDWGDGNSSFSRNNLAEGNYPIKVTDRFGCSVSSSYEVLPKPQPIEINAFVQAPACEGDQTADVLLDISGGYGNYSYSWSNGTVEANLWDVEAGSYDVTITDDEGCTSTSTFDIEEGSKISVSALVEPNQGTIGGKIEASALGGQEPYVFIWNDSIEGNVLENLPEGEYKLRVVDANGCQQDTLFNVPYQAPTLSEVCEEKEMGFSPNNDGVNDTFEIPCLSQFPENTLEIYNRWGQLIFEQSSYDQSWDGTLEGAPLPEATYFWVLTIQERGRLLQIDGTITLVR